CVFMFFPPFLSCFVVYIIALIILYYNIYCLQIYSALPQHLAQKRRKKRGAGFRLLPMKMIFCCRFWFAPHRMVRSHLGGHNRWPVKNGIFDKSGSSPTRSREVED